MFPRVPSNIFCNQHAAQSVYSPLYSLQPQSVWLPPVCPLFFLTFCVCLSSVCECVCTHLHTQTPISSQPDTEGGPRSWPQLLSVSLLTHYVWQATLLLLSCCSRALPPTSSPFLVQTHTHKVQFPLMQGFWKPSQCVPLPFAPYTYYAKAFFSVVVCAEQVFTSTNIHYL